MVNTTKLKLTYLQTEIMRELYKQVGTSTNQRQLAVALHVSQPAIKKALPLLEKTNYICLQKDSQTKRYDIQLQTQNPYVLQLKMIDNLKQIVENGLIELLEKTFAGATIILFGSYCRGEDTIHSDIDIAIIGRKEKKVILTSYEKDLQRNIHLTFFDSFTKIQKYLKENLANGIVLSGGFEL